MEKTNPITVWTIFYRYHDPIHKISFRLIERMWKEAISSTCNKTILLMF